MLMKKIFSIVALSLMSIVAMNAKTLYLNTGGSDLWDQADAKFAIWHWQDDNQGQWSAFMTKGADGIYSAEIAESSNKVIFVRLDAIAEAPDWEKKWNQTGDLWLLESGENQFNITGWGSDGGNSEGNWSFYATTALPEIVTQSTARKIMYGNQIVIKHGNTFVNILGGEVK